MASPARDPRAVTVTIQYGLTPPQVFVAQVNRFFQEHRSPGRDFHVHLRWEHVEVEVDPHPQGTAEETQHSTGERFPSHPKGYRNSRHHPVLRGQNNCPYCLCSPCVIALPPDFLRGRCSPHPANNDKRRRLYYLFWGLLNSLGVWRDEEYLRRKELRTVREDRREIIPNCVITEVRERYPSVDGQYRDYMSTFEAENAI